MRRCALPHAGIVPTKGPETYPPAIQTTPRWFGPLTHRCPWGPEDSSSDSCRVAHSLHAAGVPVPLPRTGRTHPDPTRGTHTTPSVASQRHPCRGSPWQTNIWRLNESINRGEGNLGPGGQRAGGSPTRWRRATVKWATEAEIPANVPVFHKKRLETPRIVRHSFYPSLRCFSPFSPAGPRSLKGSSFSSTLVFKNDCKRPEFLVTFF